MEKECPCNHCDVGWGSSDSQGTRTCHETCTFYSHWIKEGINMTKELSAREKIKHSILYCITKIKEGLFDDDQLNEQLDYLSIQLHQYYVGKFRKEMKELYNSIQQAYDNLQKVYANIKMLDCEIPNATNILRELLLNKDDILKKLEEWG